MNIRELALTKKEKPLEAYDSYDYGNPYNSYHGQSTLFKGESQRKVEKDHSDINIEIKISFTEIGPEADICNNKYNEEITTTKALEIAEAKMNKLINKNILDKCDITYDTCEYYDYVEVTVTLKKIKFK